MWARDGTHNILAVIGRARWIGDDVRFFEGGGGSVCHTDLLSYGPVVAHVDVARMNLV